MKIALNAAQRRLRDEVAEFLDDLMTPALRHELETSPSGEGGGGPEFRAALRKMGEAGYICMGWPKELGGGEVTPLEQFIFTDEVMRVAFPYPFLTTDAVGPVLARHAGPELQETVVDGIRQGKVICAIGYSEPNAGTDLASLKTRAEHRDGEWVINGQKSWTSLANISDYIWLAARTDPDASKRHKGLSMFIVPTDVPGYSVTPIHTLGVRTNATYYQDVRVPETHLVGELNRGWKLITGQLNTERLGLSNPGMISSLCQEVGRWAARNRAPDGELWIDKPWVRRNLAQVHVGIEALRTLCWKQAWTMTHESLNMAQASAAKVASSEFFIEAYRLLMEIIGPDACLAKDSPGAVLHGKLEHRYRAGSVMTFGGGTNEVQRDIIATVGLGMPRYAR